MWSQFFRAIDRDPPPQFIASSPGSMVHAYLEAQLAFGRAVDHYEVARRYRTKVLTHHQQRLENARSDVLLDRLELVTDWLEAHL
jgi:hypothetical protein